jgi:hypothetical protein
MNTNTGYVPLGYKKAYKIIHKLRNWICSHADIAKIIILILTILFFNVPLFFNAVYGLKRNGFSFLDQNLIIFSHFWERLRNNTALMVVADQKTMPAKLKVKKLFFRTKKKLIILTCPGDGKFALKSRWKLHKQHQCS